MTDKIAVDRDFLEHAVVALEYAYSADDEMVQESIKYLRAALAQKAEPDGQEAALQKIADFGQDQEPQPPIDNAFVAEGCEQFSPPSEPAPVPCCGKYETCSHACTPRGKWLGRREGRRVLAIVPPGYVLVPIEPTPEMIDAGLGKLLYVASPQPRHIYRAMIAAAKRVAP